MNAKNGPSTQVPKCDWTRKKAHPGTFPIANKKISNMYYIQLLKEAQCQPYVVTTLLPVHGLLGDTFDIQNTLLVKVSMQLRQN